MNAIYIFWLRQLKRFWRSKSRIIGSLGQPVLFLLALGFGFGPIYQKAGEGNYLQFLVPGVIGMSLIFSAIFFGIELIWDKQFGFLKETMVAPVPRFYIMLGRTLGGATVATIQGLIVFILSFAVGFRITSWALLPAAILVMFLITILFTALGTAIASVLQDMHGFQLIMSFLVMPLFFLSGAIFPLSSAPKALEVVARFDPLSYGVDGLRATLIGNSYFHFGLDLTVLAVLSFLFLAFGSFLFTKMEVK